MQMPTYHELNENEHEKGNPDKYNTPYREVLDLAVFTIVGDLDAGLGILVGGFKPTPDKVVCDS